MHRGDRQSVGLGARYGGQSSAAGDKGVSWRLGQNVCRDDEKCKQTTGGAASPAPVVVAPATTAKAFLTLVTASKQTGQDDAIAAKDQAKLEQERQVKALLQEHVGTPAWTALLERAGVAATLGENSFELNRFPVNSAAMAVERSTSPRRIGRPP